jgi:hypothetical protein
VADPIDVTKLSREELEARCAFLARENAILTERIALAQGRVLRRRDENVGLRKVITGARKAGHA